MSKIPNKKDSPMTMISLRLPEEMVTELKKIAPLIGESGYQPLIRSYIEQGLAQDIERIEKANNVDYIEDVEKAETKRETRNLSEASVEYIVERPTEFVVGPPTEQNAIMENETEEKAWGKNLVALLNSFSETGWEDVGDPVEWVEETRKKRREGREKPL